MINSDVTEWVNIQNRQCALNQRDAGKLHYVQVNAIAALDAEARHPRLVHYTASCGRVGPGGLADASLNERGIVVAAYCTRGPRWTYYESTEASPLVDDRAGV